MNPEQFYAYVEKWSEELAVLIEKLRSEEKEVYLIALSRKMPRFLHWVECTHLVKAEKLKTLLGKGNVHLTTELAIPLICADIDDDKRNRINAIIVDDAVIYGNTLIRAGKDWLAFSGKKPYYSAVFQLVDTEVPSVFENSSPKGVLLSLPLLLKAVRHISKSIISASLPVDIEYPIITVEASYEYVRECILEDLGSSAQRRGYEVSASVDGETAKSFSILLPEEGLKRFNNDFAKVRVFPSVESGEQCRLEIIAPNEIGLTNLKSKDYFIDEPYKDLWNSVLVALASDGQSEKGQEYDSVPMGNRVEESKELLATVWLNYLLSLSTFCRNFGHLVAAEFQASVDINDLSLILGNKMALMVTSRINDLLCAPSESSSTRRENAELPIIKIDRDFLMPYLTAIAEKLKEGLDVDESLDSIFRVSHFTSNLFRIDPDINLCIHNAIGETFDSLPLHMKTKFHTESSLMEKIHRWVDRRIDESRIAPKYAKIMGSDGEYYYRRFFFSGTNELNSPNNAQS